MGCDGTAHGQRAQRFSIAAALFLSCLAAGRANAFDTLSPYGLSATAQTEILKTTKGLVDFRQLSRPMDVRQLDPAAQPLPPPGFFYRFGDLSDPRRDISNAGSSSHFFVHRDPELADAWWLDALRVPQAWDLASGKNQTIAHCDAGFYAEESDLNANLRLDLRHDFADHDSPLIVDDGNYVSQGTASAAIMVAIQNGRGTNGIAFNARLIPLQNFNYDRQLDDISKEEATAKCVLYAIQQPEVGIIIVNSQTDTGTAETDHATLEAVRLAVVGGITVVLPAGNRSLELRAEGNNDSGAIVVGALWRNGRPANFSNFGSRINVGAFGEQVRTLYGPAGRFEIFGGTAAAAAQVAAIVALMREANPNLTPEATRAIIEQTRITTATNNSVGGQIDAYAAVKLASNWPISYDEARAQAETRRHLIEILRREQSPE